MPNVSKLIRKHGPFLFCIAVGVSLWFVPPPEGLTSSAMHLFAIFVSVILSLLFTDYPISIVCAMGLCVMALTQSAACTSSDGTFVDCSMCLQAIEEETFRNGGGTMKGVPCGKISDSVFKTSLVSFHRNDRIFLDYCIGFRVDLLTR
jgi:hypothetical protein